MLAACLERESSVLPEGWDGAGGQIPYRRVFCLTLAKETNQKCAGEWKGQTFPPESA